MNLVTVDPALVTRLGRKGRGSVPRRGAGVAGEHPSGTGKFRLQACLTSVIASNSRLDDHSRSIWEQERERTRKGVVLGDDARIGYAVRILYRVTVGSDSTLAAGSVITRDVPEHSIIRAVPGSVLRMRRERHR